MYKYTCFLPPSQRGMLIDQWIQGYLVLDEFTLMSCHECLDGYVLCRGTPDSLDSISSTSRSSTVYAGWWQMEGIYQQTWGSFSTKDGEMNESTPMEIKAVNHLGML